MAEAASIGILPHVFWDYTWRELHNALVGSGIRTRRSMKRAAYTAWQTANWTKAKRLPDLAQIYRKLDPPRVMSPRAIRSSIIALAQSMGATVVRKTRGE